MRSPATQLAAVADRLGAASWVGAGSGVGACARGMASVGQGSHAELDSTSQGADGGRRWILWIDAAVVPDWSSYSDSDEKGYNDGIVLKMTVDSDGDYFVAYDAT